MRVAIVHPWLPQYRVEFFHELVNRAEEVGISVDVFHGPPPPEWASRGDSRQDARFAELPTRTIRLGRRSLNLKSVEHLGRRRYDLIIVEQALRNIETYELLARRTPLAFWGHGRTYTQPSSRLEEWCKAKLTRRGTWFFAYTEGGAAAVIARGYPAERVTVVQNSTDSATLIRDFDSVEEDEVRSVRMRHGLVGATALSIGGLDAAKRIPFQLEAARLIHDQIPGFRLLVAGSGDLAAVVERASREKAYISSIGPVFGREKALAMRCADVLVNPGRVGLVAVDSFAVGRPIATTRFPWHAPEFEYLDESNSLVSDDSIAAYAAEMVNLLTDPGRLAAMQAAALANRDRYTIVEMARRFVRGLCQIREVHS